MVNKLVQYAICPADFKNLDQLNEIFIQMEH